MNPIDRQILQIALPSIVSNITVPLLGLIDVAIVGHLGSPAYIGATAVGGMLFNIIYWIFGFLRMGTSGMTSQAYGKRDLPEIVRLLIRSVGIGLAVALCLILLQVPIRQAAFQIIRPTEEVREMATLYFHICIWGAPAMLGLYGLSGWYIGMQNSRIPMYIAITQNIVNIMASLSLVCFFGMKVEGVALGTLIAQYAGFLMGLVLWMNRYGKLKKYIVWKGVLQKEAMIRFFQVNRDIFLRTLCLVAVTLFFTSAGASQGEIILAVNTLLMQLFTLFSYVMDGFAYAGEALSGRYIGARNRKAFTDTVRHLFIWGAGLTVLFTLVYASGGNAFLALLTERNNRRRHLLLLGACHTRCRNCRLYLGRHLYRRNGNARHASLHGNLSRQLLCGVLRIPHGFRQPCPVACFSCLPVHAGRYADIAQPEGYGKKLSLKAFHDEVAINPINIYSQTNESKNKPYLLSLPEKERNARYYTQSRKYTAHQEHGLQPLHHGGEKSA